MPRFVRSLMPLVGIGLAVLAIIELVAAVQSSRYGRVAFKAVSAVFWLLIAYMLYETGKRIPTDSQE